MSSRGNRWSLRVSALESRIVPAISLVRQAVYTQSFESLINSGSSSALPFGWAVNETGANADGLISADNGSSAMGDTRSFGSNIDRALGGLRDGNLAPTFGLSFVNHTGNLLDNLGVSYFGEQWRLGATGRTDRLDFQYSTNATSLTTGTWLDADGLDFVAPVTAGTVGNLNGNLAANRAAVAGNLEGLALAPGGTLWIRWADFDAIGDDDGLAIDELIITVAGKIGGESAISTSITSDQQNAKVAIDADGDSLVVWQGSDGSDTGIWGQRYNAAGVKVGGEFLVNSFTTGAQTLPAVAMSPAGESLVTWSSAGQDGSSDGVYAQRYDAVGAKVGGEFRVNNFTLGRQSTPAVAMDATGAAVIVWTSANQDASGYGIYGQRFSAANAKSGAEFLVNTFTIGDQKSPAVATRADGNFVVVWTSEGQDGSLSGVYSQYYAAAGTKIGPEARVNNFVTGHQSAPSVAMDAGGQAIVVWQSDAQDGSGLGIFGQRYLTATGFQKSGSEFRVNTRTAGDQSRPSVAIDTDANGTALVVWMSDGIDGSGTAIVGQRFYIAGQKLGGETLINGTTSGNQESPAVAADATGTARVVWSGVEPGNSTSSILGQQLARVGGDLRVNTFTANSQSDAKVAVDADGDALVVWSSYGQDVSSWGVYGQRYNAAGHKIGGEFRVNTATANQQRYPAVAVDADGDSWVVWQSYGQDGSGYGIYGQRFDSAGAKVGAEFRVNTVVASNQRNPAVAIDADGDVLVVWASDSQDGSSYGIYGQRFDNTGAKVGGEFAINTFTAASQNYPRVAMNSAGDALVTWQSDGQDGNGYGLYGQRFNAAGAKIGGEFAINSHTTNNQITAAAALDADGDALIVWQSFAQLGTNFSVHGQRFDASGAKVGGEIVIPGYTGAAQTVPQVAFDAGGNALVVWSAAGLGVFGQRFDATGGSIGGEFPITRNDGGRVALAVADDGESWIFTGLGDIFAQQLAAPVFPSGGTAQVVSVQVNDGAAQRSMVTSLRVTFDSPISFVGDPAAAFTLQNQKSGGVVSVAVAMDASNTVATLTFTGGEVASAGSLMDGRHTLTVHANQIAGPGLGADFILVGTPANGLFRLFGDADGSGTVDSADFLAFRLAFLSNSATFDHDGDSTVGPADFLAFRLRFLQGV